jgi:signal transduction histidine kinase
MRERAEQLGGSLEAGPAPVRGWRVRARLPLERVTA